MKKTIYAGFLLLLLAACKKEQDTGMTGTDANRISYVVADNLFSFSCFNAALTRTGYDKTLLQPGPFTVLVPDDNAFRKAGYSSSAAVLTESLPLLNTLVPYHIFEGRLRLDQYPLQFNQELKTLSGTSAYLTRWLSGADTITTINGVPVTAFNLGASNGLIQVAGGVLKPLVREQLAAAIASDTSLTFFNIAFQQADMKSVLAEKGPYTVFAPGNKAFRARGFYSADSVSRTSPAVLRNLLGYALVRERRFIYDYALIAGASGQYQETLLNGKSAVVSILRTGNAYNGVVLRGPGNTSDVHIINENGLTDNGVLHITDRFLE